MEWQARHDGSGSDIVLHQCWPIAGARRVRRWHAAINVTAWLFPLCILYWTIGVPPRQLVDVIGSYVTNFPDLPLQDIVGGLVVIFAFIVMPLWYARDGLAEQSPPPKNVRLAVPRSPDEWRKLAGGLAFGLAAELERAFGRGPGGAVAPRQLPSNELMFGVGVAFGLALWPAFVLAFVLPFVLPVVLPLGPAGGLALGLAGGLLFGSPDWVRYRIAVVLAALQRRLPLRFGSFLDWSHGAGVLRVSGIAYQFRHRELQDWLTSHVPAEVPATLDA